MSKREYFLIIIAVGMIIGMFGALLTFDANELMRQAVGTPLMILGVAMIFVGSVAGLVYDLEDENDPNY